MEGLRPAIPVAHPSGRTFHGAVLGSIVVHALLITLLVPFRNLIAPPVLPGFQEIPVELVIDALPAPRVATLPLTAAVPAAPAADLAPAADAAAPPPVPPVASLAPAAPDAAAPDPVPAAPEATPAAAADVVPAAPEAAPAAAPIEAAAAASAPEAVQAQAQPEAVPASPPLPVAALPAAEPPPLDQPALQAALPPQAPPSLEQPVAQAAAPPPPPMDQPVAPVAALPPPPVLVDQPVAQVAALPPPAAAPPSAAPATAAAAPDLEAAVLPVPLRAPAEPAPPLEGSGPARDTAPVPPSAENPAVASSRDEPASPASRDEPAPVAPAPVEVARLDAAAPAVAAEAPRELQPVPDAAEPDASADIPARKSGPAEVAASALPPAPDLAAQEPPQPRPAERPGPPAADLAAREPAPQLPPEARPSQPADSRLAALVEPPVRAAPNAERAVASALRDLDCARVSARFDPGRQVVELAGHVSSDAQRAQLRQRLASLPDVRAVQDQALSIVGNPFCRVLTFLERPGLVRSEDQTQDLAAVVGSAGEAGVVRFTGGMLLQLELQAPKFPSYVYVDYFSADGQVHHLLPGEDPRGNRFGPDERFVLGGARGRGIRDARIGPPYGLDLVVAIASNEPLFARSRGTTENAAAYLAALNATLDQRSRRGTPLKVEYAYFIINTAAP